MEKRWTIPVDGINHDVLFKSSAWSGKQTLTVDGNTIPLKQSFAQTFTGAEYPVQIGSKICQLAVVGSKADIAVDGRFVGSGKPYAPIGKVPWWGWVFVGACLLVPVVALGGALPIIIGLLGAVACARLSIAPNMATPVKVLCCLGVTVAAWAALLALIGVTAKLING